MNEGNIIQVIKPYTVGELAGIYGVSNRTLKKWLLPFEHTIGERVGRYYTVVQVTAIIEKIGLPYKVITEISF